MSTRGLAKVPKKEVPAIDAQIRSMATIIQNRRNEMKMSQETLAEEVSASVNTVKYIEQGRRIPSLPMLIRIAKVLKLSLSLSPK